jgi:chromate reductase, NAD(P)H dehydrogenase (quinone)
MKILAFTTSLRKDSLNNKLLRLAIDVAKAEGHEVMSISLEGFLLPSYDEDMETSGQTPKAAEELKTQIVNHEALMIASPEYNHSMPGHFKNTFDWISRYRPVPWRRKKVLLMSASPSLVGGYRGLSALRVPFEACGAFVFPEMFTLSSADEAFQSDGEFQDMKLQENLQSNVRNFLRFATQLSGGN